MHTGVEHDIALRVSNQVARHGNSEQLTFFQVGEKQFTVEFEKPARHGKDLEHCSRLLLGVGQFMACLSLDGRNCRRGLAPSLFGGRKKILVPPPRRETRGSSPQSSRAQEEE